MQRSTWKIKPVPLCYTSALRILRMYQVLLLIWGYNNNQFSIKKTLNSKNIRNLWRPERLGDPSFLLELVLQMFFT